MDTRTESHRVRGGDGVELHVEETGPADGRPIVFVHGYSQCLRSWRRQLDSSLAEEFRLVAFDNRGHGRSAKPRDAYDDPELWADDVRAVIETLELEAPALIGWSYGGLILSDYLATHGDGAIAGLGLVGAISEKGTDDAASFAGGAWTEPISSGGERRSRGAEGDESFVSIAAGLESTDAEESVAALKAFLERCVEGALPDEETYFMLGFNAAVPPRVRAALQDRIAVHESVLEGLSVPTLLVHGEADQIVLPAAAEKHAGLIPDAELSIYEGVGHSPFWEAPERFNRELQAFVEGL